ncbi:hypothetical protein CR513_44609, partial [Mucuna pruriens]
MGYFFYVTKKNNLYKTNLTNLTNQSVKFLVSINNDQWTWHKKLRHASLKVISKLRKHNLIRGLPSLSKNIISTSRSLELLYIDLFGPIIITSTSGKRYGFVVVDDYSR